MCRYIWTQLYRLPEEDISNVRLYLLFMIAVNMSIMRII